MEAARFGFVNPPLALSGAGFYMFHFPPFLESKMQGRQNKRHKEDPQDSVASFPAPKLGSDGGAGLAAPAYSRGLELDDL